MTNEQVRAEFEAWALSETDLPSLHRERDGIGYYYIATQRSWEAWQAARVATLREVARIATAEQFADVVLDDEELAYNEGCRDVAAAIRAAVEGS